MYISMYNIIYKYIPGQYTTSLPPGFLPPLAGLLPHSPLVMEKRVPGVENLLIAIIYIFIADIYIHIYPLGY